MVNTFCGCCELKVGCIVVAVCRVVMTVAFSVALFVFYFDAELKENMLPHVSKTSLAFYMIILIPVSIITIRCAYWFIRGATTVEKFYIDRMCHYYILQFGTIIPFILCFKLNCFLLASIEFYFMCCSISLAKERKKLVAENVLNDSESLPPQYDSCVNDTQPKISAIHVDEVQSLKNPGMEPDTNSFNNAGGETEEHRFKNEAIGENPLEKKRVEGYPLENVGGESKENSVGYDSKESSVKISGFNHNVSP